MLLAKLLQTLSEEEIRRIREEFRLGERSRLIFERVAAAPSAPPDSDSLTKAFRITKENFYSICTEIVDECVRILASNEEYSTLKFFRRKFLYRPFVTEANRIEKRLLREQDPKALEEFYAYAFRSLAEFPIGLLKLDLVQEYGKKWHRAKENPPVDDDLQIRLHIDYLRICELPTKKKMTLVQMSSRARALLDPISQRARNSTNILARSYYFLAEWKACVYERDSAHANIEWVQRILETIRIDPSLFPPETEQAFELLLAFELATTFGKVHEGLATFKKYYNGQTPETSRGALYLKRFGQIAFLARDFVTARKMVTELEKHQFVRNTPGIYIMVLLIKSMVEIVDGSTKNAVESIEMAKSINRDNFFLAWEVQIRGLETAIALKRGELSYAEQLAERNIKWLRSRRISLSTSPWIYFYQIINSIIQSRLAGEPIRASLVRHFRKDFQAEHPDFFIVLESDIAEATGSRS